jgi:subtilisin family serine protease
MPQLRYGGKNGKVVRYEVDPELVVVRTRSKRSFRSGPVPRPEAALLEDMNLVAEFPDAGVEVYRRRRGARVSVRTVREALKKSPDTRFAGRVLVDAQSKEPVVYTENVFVKFRDDEDREDCLEVLRQAGLTVKEELTYATNAFFAEAPEGTGQEIFTIANRLLERDDVEYCHPEIVQPAARRLVFDEQWHLKTTTVNGQLVTASANVAAAHALSQGEGVTIAVIDDGFDLAHEEFSSAGKIVAPRDFRSSDDDPSPGPDDNHGSACAGVACADGRFGASGVAPRARLMPLRMPLSLNSQRLADAFVWAADRGADVISNSWGPPDGPWFRPNDPSHQRSFPLPDNIRLAIDYAADRGRGGKGCVILFAAGNGNESVDLDGYASYEKVLAVTACNDRGKRSVYSDFGDAAFCAFPSNDFGFPPEGRPEPLTPGIWTVDRTGRAGYNPDPDTGDVAGDVGLKYTNGFGGTSSACPGAAGVAALVIARNPALRRQEVKEVLRQACDRIDPQGGAYDARGHSKQYGHGRLNAEAAVRLALPPEGPPTVRIERSFTEPIADFQTSTVELDVSETARLVGVQVSVDIEHTYIGDLVVTVVPPASMGVDPVVLHRRAGGRTVNLRRVYDGVVTPALLAYAGKSPRGTWTLEVRDEARIDTGLIRQFGLVLTLSESRVRRSRANRPAAGRRRRPTRRKR